MNYRRFPSSEIEVSELGIGCARLGGVFYGGSEPEAIALLRAAFDAGITFYDTADMYAQGESERLLGKAFADNRSSVIIESKVGYRLPKQRLFADKLKPLARPIIRRLKLSRKLGAYGIRGNLNQDFSADWIRPALEASLRRLQTDYLDVYLLHGLPASGIDEALSTLESLQAAGIIRSFGISCETPEDGRKCLGYARLSVIQVNASLLHQEIVPVLQDERVRDKGIVGRQCFASGLIARPSAETNFDGQPSDRRPAVEALESLARGMGRELPELALKFATDIPEVDVTLVGVRTQQHLDDALRFYASRPLTADEREAVLKKPAGLPV